MVQPPVPGRGAGADPAPGAGLPGGAGGRREPDPRLAAFAQGGAADSCPPDAALAATLQELSGPEWRCDGATDDELAGLLGRWQAVESWAAAGKLGVVRELIRRRARPGIGGRAAAMHGDLPDAWDQELDHEVAAELGISLPTAGKLTNLAWDLRARLPGIGALLAGGAIDQLKARIIAEELSVLDDEAAAQAEAMIVGRLAGKTPGQVGKLAAQAACTVDPEGARRRRERAERDEARVRLWREHGGAAALAGYGLPTDEALAANAAINTRAQEYKTAKVGPDATMDQLRVLAYLDLLNGVAAHTRIARARAAGAAAGQPGGTSGEPEGAPDGGRASGSHGSAGGQRPAGGDEPGRAPGDDGPRDGDDPAGAGDDRAGERDGGDGGSAHEDAPDAGGPRDGEDPGNGGPGDGSSGGSGGPGDRGQPGGGPAGGPVPALPASVNLTIPLATLLGLAERPGAGHGLGPLDPALARDLAATAAASPHSQWCVTVTDASGVAIGHGCTRPARTRGKAPPPGSRDGPPARTRWAFTPRDGPGPPGGYGAWALTLPGSRELTLRLGPVPVTDCDHRHESRGYHPSDTLRHLVQIRDGECTFPPCSRHARGCDFEHARPHDQGGRTCACNGGARSRRCHRVKQSRGWSVTQPRPGWHRWTTPAGRSYTQGPMQYPV
jgi:hypothetical protein